MNNNYYNMVKNHLGLFILLFFGRKFDGKPEINQRYSGYMKMTFMEPKKKGGPMNGYKKHKKSSNKDHFF